MKKWAVAMAAVLLLFSGCSNKEKENVQEPVKKEKVVEKVEDNKQEQEKQEYPYFYPLTGIGSTTETDGRAVAVMVNNHPKARPQSGLNKADVVYEVLAEGDITRFLAVFQSERPDNIGPVRSARDYYVNLAKGLNALYVAHGWSEEAKKMLEGNVVDNLNGMVYDGTLFKRSKTRKAPHNSYITYDNILKGAKQKKYLMEGSPPSFTFMSEDERKHVIGNDATSVQITYSKGGISDSILEFDPTLGKYKRFFSGGEQTVDLDTKEPVLIDNVFIIEAVHKIIDSYGRRDIDLQSGGRAYLIQMGKVNEVDWANRDGLIVPMKNGQEIPLVQGKTWVNVVPTSPGLEKSISFNVK
ncbi:hypothetical protein QE429_004783 [Bacillus sp. SORGH_AS 510]|uniref:DUF3048 domain-containing protein n=1 Tax=Bacillus sp. SORGH_AS_0510 TaxID=3041771 RepID=UPI00277FF9ED|nr:DUF3048 domain-containing protein [Bacillus sp. SORGH_AS_0510]MDQ1147956.1 hypothetical protein [Bacillus sp. SORGH_AS_0510]